MRRATIATLTPRSALARLHSDQRTKSRSRRVDFTKLSRGRKAAGDQPVMAGNADTHTMRRSSAYPCQAATESLRKPAPARGSRRNDGQRTDHM
jgi:hypothetical protein